CLADPGLVEYVYQLSDECGNSSTCTQVITVVDSLEPIIFACAPDALVECFADVPAPDVSAVATTDNCSTSTVTLISATTNGTGCAVDPGVVEYVYQATDACGNSLTCTQTITVVDSMAPVISCPLGVIVSGDAFCQASVPAFSPDNLFDNCTPTGGLVVTQSPAPGTLVTGPTNVTITLTVADACGNTNSCTTVFQVVCNPLVIAVSKSLTSTTYNLDGTYAVVYDLIVTNSGLGVGRYDLDDVPGFDGDLVIDGVSVNDNGSGAFDGSYDGGADISLATNVLLSPAESHTFTLNFDVDASALIGDPSLVDLCNGATPSPGEGLYNSATVRVPGVSTNVATACANLDLPDVFHAKALIGTLDNLDGTFDITYEITVTNAGTETGTYDLDDVPGFDSDLSILGVMVSGSANFDGGYDGSADTILATNALISAGAADVYTLVYTVDATAIIGNPSLYDACNPVASGPGEGLFNATTLIEPGTSTTVTVCEDLNLQDITHTKTVVGVTNLLDGTYTVGFEIVVTNEGNAGGIYSLDDVPGFDSDLSILGVTVSDNGSGAFDGSYDGLGDTSLAGGAMLTASNSHTYTLVFTVDASSVIADSGLYDACNALLPAPGEGLFNATSLTVPGLTNTVAACADLDLPDVSHTKTLTAITNYFDGTFDVGYTLVVTNAGIGAGSYSLSDAPGFDSDVVLTGINVNDNGSGAFDGLFDGAGDQSLATNVTLAGNSSHIYTLVFSLDATALVLDPSLVDLCDAATPGPGEGLFNAATLYEPGANTLASVCGDLPLPVQSIAGRVLFDENGDGVFDAADTNGIPVVTIQLADTNGFVLASTMTDASGAYIFTNILPGVYELIELDLVGVLSTGDIDAGDPNSILVSLPANTASVGNDFLDTAPSDITGSVFVDVNGDGVVDAADTNGIPAVAVTLLDGIGLPVTSVVTDVNGFYVFPNVPAGNYTVRESDDANYISTTDIDGANDNRIAITHVSGVDSVGNDFYDTALAGVFGQVRDDQDADADFGDVDPGITNVTVTLFDATGGVVAVTTTDLTGNYGFTNVVPGAYTVVESDPSGYVSTDDVDGGNDNTIAITLATGEVSTGNDFLDIAPVTISGSVFVDVNGDGFIDAEDTNGISTVTVTLFDATGGVVQTTSTLADGSYFFGGVLPGSYTIGETDPSGFISTTDVDAPNDNLIAVTVTSGADSAGNDFYDAALASIAGQVRDDQDADADFGDVDPGINMVVIVLRDRGGIPLATNVTDAAGNYLFANVSPGDYQITEVDPSGFMSTADVDAANDNLIEVTVFTGANSVGNDFIDTEPVTISGSVLVDVDGDGVIDPVDTTGLPGLTITLLNATGGVVQTTTTLVDGSYSFAGVIPGSYSIVESDAPGTLSTLDTDGANDNVIALTVTSGNDSAGNDFYDTTPGILAGTVFLDENGDGVFDPSETNGVPGVTIELKGTNGVVLFTTTTAADGSYTFTNVPPGDYFIDETDLPSYYSTTDVSSPNDNRIPVTLTSGQTITGQDFADSTFASLTGHVFEDINGNSAQDPGEIDLPGVSVIVTDSQSNTLVLVTDVNGNYATNVVAGTTIVDVDETTLPVGVVQTAGADPQIFNLIALGATAVGQDGYQPRGDLVGPVFSDLNGDGIQNPGEPGIPGVTIIITDFQGGTTTVVTDGDGDYLVNIPIGTATVFVVESTLPPGENQTAGDNISFVNIEQGQTSQTADGFQVQGTLSGVVYVDTDGNGVQDPGEPGISNVDMIIVNSLGVTSIVVTATDGTWSLNVPDGDTVVTVDSTTVPPEHTQTGGDNPTTVTVPVGGDVTTEDGFQPRNIRFGDRVWEDLDGNGLQDAGEPGIAGISVALFDSTGQVGAATTDTNGNYQFTGLVPESYFVEFTIPTNFVITTAFEGDPALDSNVNAAGLSDVFNLTAGDVVDTADAGLIQPARIGDTVFIDVNRDQIANEMLMELGLSGIQVDLLSLTAGVSNLVSTTVTASNLNNRGFYEFTGLLPGTYVVVVHNADVPPRVQDNTTPLSFTFTIISGDMIDTADFGFVSNPTAIELSSFTARESVNGVVIDWTTGWERDNYGFMLYRSASLNGARTLVTPYMIPSQSSGAGGTYTTTDLVSATGRYFYWLEDFDYDETRTVRGPAVVQVLGNVLASYASADQGIVKVNTDNPARVGVRIDGREVASLGVEGGVIFFVDAAGKAVDVIMTDAPLRMVAMEAPPEDGETIVIQLDDDRSAQFATVQGHNYFVLGFEGHPVILDISDPAKPVQIVGEIVEGASGRSIYFTAPADSSVRAGDL
ncbi:MAG: protocatechuate 3,4-dioxygenase beta subunit, partial [Candidatus Omnitrophota bacterium]